MLFACLSLSPTRVILAHEKQSPSATKLEQFRGRWITSRPRKEEAKIHRDELVLEFKGDELTFFTQEGGKKGNEYTLKVIGVEEGAGASRVILGFGSRSKYIVHYDFQGEKLILVGRLPNRPFEGFSLSGEYHRAEITK
jgi:hypothetical protein